MAIIPYLCPFGLSKKSYRLKCNAPTMRYVKKVSGKVNALHQKKEVHPFSVYNSKKQEHRIFFCFSMENRLLKVAWKIVLWKCYKEWYDFLSFHRNKPIFIEKFNDVINSGQLVLVDFFATWCQPCKMMHPILEQVKSVLGNRIRIIKVDVDKNDITASQYRIQSVPTLMLFRNGEVLWRTSGVVEKTELLATLDPFLK